MLEWQLTNRTKLSSGFTHYLLTKPSQTTTTKYRTCRLKNKKQKQNKKVAVSVKVLPHFKEEMLDASFNGACESKSFKKFYIWHWVWPQIITVKAIQLKLWKYHNRYYMFLPISWICKSLKISRGERFCWLRMTLVEGDPRGSPVALRWNFLSLTLCPFLLVLLLGPTEQRLLHPLPPPAAPDRHWGGSFSHPLSQPRLIPPFPRREAYPKLHFKVNMDDLLETKCTFIWTISWLLSRTHIKGTTDQNFEPEVKQTLTAR